MGVLLKEYELVGIGQPHLAVTARALETGGHLKPPATLDQGVLAGWAFKSQGDRQ